MIQFNICLAPPRTALHLCVWLAVLAFLSSAPAQVLVSTGSTWKYFKGTQEASSPTNAWRSSTFNDATWPSGPAPFRYGDGAGGTLLSDMLNGYSTVFLRHSFSVSNATVIQNLRLTTDYDDGFALWLNGTEIFRLNAPTNLAFDSSAPAQHESGTFETYTIAGAGAHLVHGTNVLAAQGFNATLGSSDFLFELRLEGTVPPPDLPNTQDTKFSVKRGFYETNFPVVVSSDTIGATITYTLDGSDPRTSATAQSGTTPVSVLIDPASSYGGRRPRLTPGVTLRSYASMPGRDPSNVDTQTYLFLHRVRTQENIVPTGPYVSWDTVMDSRVLNDARYSNSFNVAMQDIPTMSVVMDWEDLFGLGGIHRGNNLNNHALEMPCSIELIYPALPKFTNLAGFQENAGIKIQGGGGRWDQGEYDPKQSFTLLFQPQFDGPGRLQYPLFEAAPLHRETDPAEYNRVILRAGHNKSWPGPGPNWRQTTVYTRDEYFRASHLAMSGKGKSAHGTFVHLYLNGLYWGLYNPAERPDHGFLSIYFGGDGEHYDSYKQRNGDPNGDRNRLTAAQAVVANTATPYATVKEYVDTTAFADFMIVTWSGGAADGPQWYAGNARNPAGPLRWYCWDYEDSFTPLGTGRGGAGYTWTEANPLWTSIRSHPEFRIELADRVYKHCFNDGVFTDQANTNRWLTLAAYIENAIIGESARWGDEGQSSRGSVVMNYTPPLNRNDHWYPARDQVTAMLDGNSTKLINDLRTRGYFPSANANAPLFYDDANAPVAVSSLLFTNSYAVRVARDGTTGTIYWTTNGVDPRAEGGAVQGFDGGTGTNLVLTGTTTLRARVRYGTEWSPLHVLTLHAATDDFSALKITEVMYHPAGMTLAVNRAVSQILGDVGGVDQGRARIRLAAAAPGSPFGSGDEIVISGATVLQNNGRFTVERVSGTDVFLDQTLVDEIATSALAAMELTGDRYEFIELKNTGSRALNLTGARFNRGIEYEFPEGTMLAPGQFWVLTPHRSNFRDRQPSIAVQGFYMGQLGNGGERLTLSDYLGNAITTVNYNDRAPWPLSPDGLGFSLVPVTANPAGSQDDALQWRASQSAGGSPGADDPGFTVPPIKVNEVLTHTDPPLRDAIELYNPTAQAVDLSGWYLTDDRNLPQRWRIPDGMSIPASGFAVFYEGHYSGTNLLFGSNEFGIAFSLSSLGEEVHLFSPTLSYSHGFEFEAAFNGVSFGRYVTGTGEEHLPAQSARTLEHANSGPTVGPIVISEIHYHPTPNGDAFVELYNLTDEVVPLYDPAFPTNTWRLGGANFEFAASNLSLPPRGLLVLVQGDTNAPAAFRTKYSVPAQVPIYNFLGTLDNNGETLTLRRPDEPVASGPDAGMVAYVVGERVRYGDQPSWPLEADGLGWSLERINPSLYGNDPINWRASPAPHGTPGTGVEPPTTPLIATHSRNIAVTAVVGTDLGLQELNVWNAGIGTLYYQITSASPLISITPPTGASIGSAQRNLHYLQLATATLPLGTHFLTVTVQDNGSGATNSPVSVTVAVVVVAAPAPAIGFAPRGLATQSSQGHNATATSFAVFNAGTGLLNYSLTNGAAWLAVSPAAGNSSGAGDPRSHTVSFVTSNLPPGTYLSWVSINSPDAVEPLACIPVVAQVLDASEFTNHITPLIRLGFNEGAGTLILNEGSAGGNLARSTPVPSWSSNVAAGVGGTACLDFQTVSGNHFVESPAIYSELAGLTKFTVAGWVNCRNSTEGSGGNRLVTWINHGGNGVDVVYKSDGSVQVGINQWPDGSPARSSTAQIPTDANAGTNNWRFFAVTYDSTLSAGHIKFYFGSNGSPAALDLARNYARGAVGANIGRLCVGHFNVATRSGAQDRMFRGLMDEVQVFDKALSLEELREIQAGTRRPPLTIRLDRLSAEWLLLTWTGANLNLEEATNATGPWTIRSNQGGAQLLEPAGDRRFFRMRAP